jgi:hypothetical protein
LRLEAYKDGALVETINFGSQGENSYVERVSVTRRTRQALQTVPGGRRVYRQRIGPEATVISFDAVCTSQDAADKLRKIVNESDLYDEVRLYLKDTRFYRLAAESVAEETRAGYPGRIPIRVTAVSSDVYELGAETVYQYVEDGSGEFALTNNGNAPARIEEIRVKGKAVTTDAEGLINYTGSYSTSFALSNVNWIAQKFHLNYEIEITKVYTRIYSDAIGRNITCKITADANGIPGSTITSTSISTNWTGVTYKNFNFNVVLSPGDYWVVFEAETSGPRLYYSTATNYIDKQTTLDSVIGDFEADNDGWAFSTNNPDYIIGSRATGWATSGSYSYYIGNDSVIFSGNNYGQISKTVDLTDAAILYFDYKVASADATYPAGIRVYIGDTLVFEKSFTSPEIGTAVISLSGYVGQQQIILRSQPPGNQGWIDTFFDNIKIFKWTDLSGDLFMQLWGKPVPDKPLKNIIIDCNGEQVVLGNESADQTQPFDNASVKLDSTSKYVGLTFQPSEAELSKIIIRAKKTGSPGSLKAVLKEYDTTDNVPTGAELASADNIDTDISDTESDVYIPLSATLDTTKTYIVYFVAASADSSNYYEFSILSDLFETVIGDFEAGDDEWTYSEVDTNGVITGIRTTGWSSRGNYSYHIRFYGATETGDYGKISKTVDLTDISTLKFDRKIAWQGPVTTGYYRLRVYIAGTLVLDKDIVDIGQGSVGEESIDVSGYAGQQQVEIMLYTGPGSPGSWIADLWIDNIRLVSLLGQFTFGDGDPGRMVTSVDSGSTWSEYTTDALVFKSFYTDPVTVQILRDEEIVVKEFEGTVVAKLVQNEPFSDLSNVYEYQATYSQPGYYWNMSNAADYVIWKIDLPYPTRNFKLSTTLCADGRIAFYYSLDGSEYTLFSIFDNTTEQGYNTDIEIEDITTLYIKALALSDGTNYVSTTTLTAELRHTVEMPTLLPGSNTVKVSYDPVGSEKAEIEVRYRDAYA